MFLLCYAQVYGAFGRTALLQTFEDDLASSSDLRLRAALLALTLATGQPQLPGSGGLSMTWASTAVRWTYGHAQRPSVAAIRPWWTYRAIVPRVALPRGPFGHVSLILHQRDLLRRRGATTIGYCWWVAQVPGAERYRAVPWRSCDVSLVQ